MILIIFSVVVIIVAKKNNIKFKRGVIPFFLKTTMKTSQYNIFFTFQEQIVGYNSLQDDYIFLAPELYNLYLECETNGIDNLGIIHPEFYDILKEKKFCVTNDTDELQLVKCLVQNIDSNTEEYYLIINPTMNCNFSCWYCYETHIKSSKMGEGEIQNIIIFIDKKLIEGKIKDFSDKQLRIAIQTKSFAKFEISHHSLNIYGFCNKCKSSK